MNLLRGDSVGGRIVAGDLETTAERVPDGPLVVGVRPEAFHLSDGRTDEPVLAVRVEVVEPLGHESIVYGSIRGERAPAVGTEAGLPPLSSERATIVARLGGKAQPAVGEAISLAFSPRISGCSTGRAGARSRTAGSRSHPRRIPNGATAS